MCERDGEHFENRQWLILIPNWLEDFTENDWVDPLGTAQWNIGKKPNFCYQFLKAIIYRRSGSNLDLHEFSIISRSVFSHFSPHMFLDFPLVFLATISFSKCFSSNLKRRLSRIASLNISFHSFLRFVIVCDNKSSKFQTKQTIHFMGRVSLHLYYLDVFPNYNTCYCIL